MQSWLYTLDNSVRIIPKVWYKTVAQSERYTISQLSVTGSNDRSIGPNIGAITGGALGAILAVIILIIILVVLVALAVRGSGKQAESYARGIVPFASLSYQYSPFLKI